MKTLMKFSFLILAVLSFISCDRDYDSPPFNEPVYNGKANITVQKLKEVYGATAQGTPTLIETAYVLKAYVVSDDEAGNVYKQLYIQDETGGINIGIEANSLYTTYIVGQEVFVELHGLAIVKYGGELQIGYIGTNANRIPEDFSKTKIFKNGWPDKDKVTPKVVKINELTADMVNTLVRIDNIYFVNGGVGTFTVNDANTSQAVKDANNNIINVRTSSYASFAKDTLPAGSGSMIGLLGRFNGEWQFTIRSKSDLINFGGSIPGPDPEPGTVYAETFGTADLSAVNPKPKIGEYTGYDNKSPIAYEGSGDIRSTKAFDNHVWMTKGQDANLLIKGLNTAGKSNLVLSYDLTFNIFSDGESANINSVKVYYNGTELSVPSIVLDKAGGYGNKYYNVTIDISKLEMKDNSTVEFKSSPTDNTLGIRLDNIKIVPKQ